MVPRGGKAALDLVASNETIAVRQADISASPHRAPRSAARINPDGLTRRPSRQAACRRFPIDRI